MSGAAFGLRKYMQGDGSCIVCYQGTDTGLAFGGSREWLAAGLVSLGVPTHEAVATIEESIDGSARMSATFRVCADCVRRSHSNLPNPALIYVGGEIPCIWEPIR